MGNWLLTSSLEEVVLREEHSCCSKANPAVGEGEGGSLKRATLEMLKCVFMCMGVDIYVYTITPCIPFSASGSAGKGSRPVDIGPDYKPPLGGKCCSSI